ncbi:MAG: UvrD-helicase domain-containing protein [Clostridia bacterium]|nr:UvrD-helicase domain-containing protein [Clostridia bacterium]
MEFKPTSEQKRIIDGVDCNMLVPASAGTGKTTVMIERIIELLRTSRLKLGNLAVLTFTKQAAEEMKQRLVEAINDSCAEYSHMAKLAVQADDAFIGTIHSFCANIVRTYFYTVGVNPNFGILSQIRSDKLKAEVLDRVFKKYYAVNDRNFIDLVDFFGTKRNDGGLRREVLNIYTFMESQPDYAEWYEGKRVFHFDGSYERYLDEEMSAIAEFYLAEGNKLLAEVGGEYKKLADSLKVFVSEVELFRNADYAKKRSCDLTFPVMRKDKTLEDDALYISLADRFSQLKTDFKKLIGAFRIELADGKSQEDALAHTDALSKLATEFYSLYCATKEKQGELDYSDLERLALKVLKDEGARRELSEKYSYVFVDEYQDVNDIQEEILSEVCGGWYFAVGDVKQSIYGFRHCRPANFLKRQRAYAEGEGDVIHLSGNFRSHHKILEFVNAVFSELMTDEFGGVDYAKEGVFHGSKADKALIPAVNIIVYDDRTVPESVAKANEGLIAESCLNENSGERSIDTAENNSGADRSIGTAEKNSGAEQRATQEQATAEIIAENLSKLIGRSAGARVLTYGDIAVLARTSNELTALDAELKRRNIPTMLYAEQSFFDGKEVGLLVCFLRALSNPKDDLSFYSFATGRFGGLSDDEASKLVKYSVKPHLYDRVDDILNCKADCKADCGADHEVSLDLDSKADCKADCGADHEVSLDLDCRLNGKSADSDGGIYSADTLNKIDCAVQATCGERGCRLEAEEPLLYEKVRKMWDFFHRYLRLRESLCAEKLLKMLIEESNYREYLLSLSDGCLRLERMSKFINSLSDLEEGCSVERLLYLLDTDNKSKFNGGNISDADRVKLMTMHSSKGLEFPVVFAVGLDRQFYFSNEQLKYIKELGMAQKYYDSDERSVALTTAYFAIDNAKKKESRQEELRLFYVALTRAQNHLFLIGKNRKGLFVQPTTPFRSMNSRLSWTIGALSKKCNTQTFEELRLALRAVEVDLSLYQCKSFSQAEIGKKVIFPMGKEQAFTISVNGEQRTVSGAEYVRLISASITKPPYVPETPQKLSASRIKSYMELHGNSNVEGVHKSSIRASGLVKETICNNTILNGINDNQTTIGQTNESKATIGQTKKDGIGQTNISYATIGQTKKDGIGQTSDDESFEKERAADQIFELEEEPDRAEKGSIYHKILELAPLGSTVNEIKSIIEQVVKEGNFSRAAAEAVDIYKLVAAVNDRSLIKMSLWADVYKEQSFMVDLPLSLLTGQKQSGNVMLQGVIDLLFVGRDRKRAAVVDYKLTQSRLRISDYTPQIRAYCAAVKRILCIDNVDGYLYDISHGRLIHVDYDSGAALSGDIT